MNSGKTHVGSYRAAGVESPVIMALFPASNNECTWQQKHGRMRAFGKTKSLVGSGDFSGKVCSVY